MVTLISPGVSVSITNESPYATSGQGTIPLIVLATASNKASPVAGGTVAPYTVPSMANKLYLATSQQDLIQNFGNPIFYSTQGTPLNGYELNEYGLWTGWSYLGIANRAYILRADIDLASLAPTTTAPAGPPVAGTYWLNLDNTAWGVFQANGSTSPGAAWNPVTVLVAGVGNVGANPNPDNPLNTEQSSDDGDQNWPLTSFGSAGNVCVVPTTASNYFYENVGGNWFRIGSYDWMAAHPTQVTGSIVSPTVTPSTTVIINTHTVTISGGHTTAAGVVTDITGADITDITASVAGSGALVITNTAGGNVVIGAGTANTALGLTAKTYNGVTVTRNNNATYPSGTIVGSFWIKGNPANQGAKWSVNYYSGTTNAWQTLTAPFYAFDSTADDSTPTAPDPTKDSAVLAAFTAAVGNVYVGYDVITGDQQLRRWSGTSWQPLTYEADADAPSTAPPAGTNWFNTNFTADIMVGNGENWIGYRTQFPETDQYGVQIAGSAPTTQSDGTSELVEGDLWIDGSDLENYPMLYTWNATSLSWTLVDNTDNTTPFGIIFADARQDSGTAYLVQGASNSSQTDYAFNSTASVDMALSSFVDPDAPDPRTYPAGMMLFNTRYSTYNVKRYNPLYFKAGGFSPTTDYTNVTYNVGDPNIFLFPALSNSARWVTASGNSVTGTPYMGRKAQRIMVVTALASAIASNEDIRSEIVFFNLMAAPGYPETIPDFISLNTDMNQVAFQCADTPIRLASDGTSVQNWAANAANAPITGEDGLTVADDYTAVWYPWGLGVNLDGTDIMIPPSAIGLVTIAYNDQVAYPWYAPAGFTRGLVTNASSVGYLGTNGDYTPVILNQGQRDVLYTNNIDPIAYIPNRGLVVYGQKTLSPTATALSRINVARLMNYIAYNLDIILKPFLFEPNTPTTRATATTTVQNFLGQLVTLNGLYDYAVVCDASNNTAAEEAANELWMDVAVTPVDDIEFIYVPVRVLTNTVFS